MAGPSSTFECLSGVPETAPPIFHSGWLKQERIFNLLPSDLSNDIHPMFDRENFMHDPSEAEYASLRLSLQLASHLIERLLPVFHTIFFNTPEKIPGPDDEVFGSLPDPLEKLTPQQADETRKMLNNLANALFFDFSDDERKQAGGMTIPLPEWNIDAVVPGVGSVILLSATKYQKAIDCASNPEDLPDLFWSAFSLANCLQHEVVHAAANAASWDFSDYNDIVFLGPTDEHGHFAETFLWGGPLSHSEFAGDFHIFNDQYSDMLAYPVLHDMPSPFLIGKYMELNEHKDSCGIHTREKLESSIHCMWNVSFLDIAKVFYDDFWREKRDTRFEKKTAWRFDAVEQLRVGWATSGLGPEDKVSGVPEGFVVDERGLVVKAESVVASAKPAAVSAKPADVSPKSRTKAIKTTIKRAARAMSRMPMTSTRTVRVTA